MQGCFFLFVSIRFNLFYRTTLLYYRPKSFFLLNLIQFWTHFPFHRILFCCSRKTFCLPKLICFCQFLPIFAHVFSFALNGMHTSIKMVANLPWAYWFEKRARKWPNCLRYARTINFALFFFFIYVLLTRTSLWTCLIAKKGQTVREFFLLSTRQLGSFPMIGNTIHILSKCW